MQPNQVLTPPPAQPNSPFDFMLNEEKKGRRFGLPSGTPKPMLILVIVVVFLFVVLIFGSIFKGGGTSNSTQIVDLMAQNQEIIRVSALSPDNFKDPNDLALSATAISTLTSQQTQFSSYLTKVKAKYKASQLASYVNTSTAAQLQTAVINNNFDKTYMAYLQGALQKYQNSILSTSKTSSKNFDQILSSAFNSNKTLLASPQLALASPN
jgi:hypothetical protein